MTESVVSTCEAAGIDLAALPAAPPAPRRTLVLSGGGGRGAWQVGACEHLILERGYGFDLIAGVSAGAVNGATLAQAHDHDELEAELEHLRSVWFGLRGNHDIYRSRPLGRVRMVLGRHPGVYEPGPLREILLEHIDPSRVATSPVQLRVGYVHLVTGRYRTAGNDDPALRVAKLASRSLPVEVTLLRLRDWRAVDGMCGYGWCIRSSGSMARRWTSRLPGCGPGMRMGSGRLAQALRSRYEVASRTGEHLRGELRAGHAGADLLERRVAGCGRIVAERRESAVVGRTQLRERDDFGSFQDAIANLVGRLDSRIDRVDHTDEDLLVGLGVLLDDPEDPAAVLLARKLDVEVPRLEME